MAFRPVLLQSHFSSSPHSLQKSPAPICMFYFSHPFGISTPGSANKSGNVGSTPTTKKASKYTTTTYLVTEIQKNHSDGSQDEAEPKKHPYTDRELIAWPKNFMVPPLVQLLEKKHGKFIVYYAHAFSYLNIRERKSENRHAKSVTKNHRRK